MQYSRIFAWAGFLLSLLFLSAFTVYAESSLLNVPFDADVEKLLGPWAEIRKTHFGNGGICDQIAVK